MYIIPYTHSSMIRCTYGEHRSTGASSTHQIYIAVNVIAIPSPCVANKHIVYACVRTSPRAFRKMYSRFGWGAKATAAKHIHNHKTIANKKRERYAAFAHTPSQVRLRLAIDLTLYRCIRRREWGSRLSAHKARVNVPLEECTLSWLRSSGRFSMHRLPWTHPCSSLIADEPNYGSHCSGLESAELV